MKRIALLTIVLACVCAWGDTIRLKNGTSIAANKVTVRGDQVEYVVGSTTYYIPKSQVDRIESGATFGITVTSVSPGAKLPSAGLSGNTEPAQVATPGQQRRSGPPPEPLTVPNGRELLKRILNYGHIDERALVAIEGEGDPDKSAAAYAVAANYEYVQNDVNRARVYAGRALEFAPENIGLLCWYSELLAETGQYPEALSRAERAVKLGPTSPDAYFALGAVYYITNRLPEAIRAWKRSLELRPYDVVKEYLAKAEREVGVEENFREKESSHFMIRYQGERTGFTLAGDVLHALERDYAELSRELNYTPQISITVLLYTEKEFFDVTQSPAWAGGANDGKLRIPVKNVTILNAEFQRVLKHELTHSFIHLITRGRCPGWINEGIAQMMEPRDPAMYGAVLARIFKERKQAPLRALDGSFAGFSDVQAQVAYAESLVVVDHLRSVYGMAAIQRILEQLASGEVPEEAVREVTHTDYAQLEKETGAYLSSTYQTQ